MVQFGKISPLQEMISAEIKMPLVDVFTRYTDWSYASRIKILGANPVHRRVGTESTLSTSQIPATSSDLEGLFYLTQ
jgi:hypothetical protein